MVDAARRDVLALDAEDPAYDAAVAQLLEAEAAQLATGAPRSAAQRDRSWFRRSAPNVGFLRNVLASSGGKRRRDDGTAGERHVRSASQLPQSRRLADSGAQPRSSQERARADTGDALVHQAKVSRAAAEPGRTSKTKRWPPV